MKLNGKLIVNAGLKGKKFDELNQTLISSAENNGIKLDLCDNVSAYALLSIPFSADFILFWDKDITLARHFENMSIRLFNRADAIEKCDSKALTYISLLNSGIRMPKTLTSPLVFCDYDYSDSPFLDDAEKHIGYPMVLKECFGSFGFQVYLVKSREELLKKIKDIGRTPFVLQSFVASSCGRDIRIEVVGGRAVASMMRYSASDFRANITSGGSMMPYVPTETQVDMAISAANILGLDFCGVDILFGECGNDLLCEVNSNAHINNISSCTGVDVADLIMKHIVSELK